MVVMEVACERRGVGQVAPGWIVVTEDGCLVMHDGAHVGPECIHVLANGDLVLLGLIPVRIKSGGEVLYLLLQCSGRTDRVLLLRWLLWWGLSG